MRIYAVVAGRIRRLRRLLVAAGVNGTKVTWMSADQVSVTLDNGTVGRDPWVRARLDGGGLSRQVVNALDGTSGGTANSVGSSTLDGLDQISPELLQCRIASGGIENVEALGKIGRNRAV